MAFRRRDEPPIDDEREALRAQHAALEDLKRQLSERVDAVRERELELHHALAEVSSAQPANAVARPLPAPAEQHVAATPVLPPARNADADGGEAAVAAQRREQALVEREGAIAAAEAALLARTRQIEQDPARDREQLAARERKLEAELERQA